MATLAWCSIGTSKRKQTIRPRSSSYCIVLACTVAYVLWSRSPAVGEREQSALKTSAPVRSLAAQLAGAERPHIALCISGASRSDAALAVFAAAVRQHVLPAASTARVQVVGWLQDNAAEVRLEQLFHEPAFGTTTRRMLTVSLS